jgi:hypothetical protein
VLEYAVALTVLIQIMFGIVDLGRAYFLYAELDHAVNEGLGSPQSTSRSATSQRELSPAPVPAA